MTALLAERAVEVVAAAQQLLARRMGAPVKLVDPVELGGSGRTIVLRVRVAENTFALPRTLVIKQVLAAGDHKVGSAEPGVVSVDSAFLREAVSYQFATALARENRPGADLLAYDLEARLLVLSDLGDSQRLTEVLRHALSDGAVRPNRANVLMAFAQALGRMHAATVGREDDFTALLRRVELAHRVDGIAAQAEAAVEEVPGLLSERLGVAVPDDVLDEVRRCVPLFGVGPQPAPNRMRAFSPSDLCPDNIIVNENGVRFLDYEWGGFRDATLDIAYALVSFPGCLCDHDLSRDLSRQMVEAWRAEVVHVWPQLADDDVLARKILDARLMWVWLTTFWFLPGDHARVAAARAHGLSVPRSHALLRRWAGLAEDARILGDDTLADFAEAVTATLDADNDADTPD
ncbi:MAG: kinase [Mycobacteriaceae bacterium]|nr:kinase [Mycobacteriaceae bacterium]